MKKRIPRIRFFCRRRGRGAPSIASLLLAVLLAHLPQQVVGDIRRIFDDADGFRQREYGDRQLHKQAEVRLRALLLRAGVAVVEMDTTVPRQANRNGIGTEAEFESICARLDAVVTNRLHGTVLALKMDAA